MDQKFKIRFQKIYKKPKFTLLVFKRLNGHDMILSLPSSATLADNTSFPYRCKEFYNVPIKYLHTFRSHLIRLLLLLVTLSTIYDLIIGTHRGKT